MVFSCSERTLGGLRTAEYHGLEQGSGPPTKNPAGRIFREIKILPGSGEERPARREARQDFLFAGAPGPGPGRIFFSLGPWAREPGRISFSRAAWLARGRAGFFEAGAAWAGVRAGFFAVAAARKGRIPFGQAFRSAGGP